MCYLQIQDPETAAKLDAFLEKVANLKKLEQPFEIVSDMEHWLNSLRPSDAYMRW